jgi:dihydroxyacetone kinase-like predicted kinase
VIEGGQTMNPSAADLLEAIDSVPTQEVIVLPNNSNVVLTAEQAAALSSKDVHVVPTASVQAGLAAMGSYVVPSSLAENLDAMSRTLESISTGEVTIASRDAEVDGVRITKGAYLGFVDGKAVVSDADLVTVARAVVEGVLEGDSREVLNILVGEDAPSLDGLVAALQADHPEVVVDVHDGGQPHYPLLVVAE